MKPFLTIILLGLTLATAAASPVSNTNLTTVTGSILDAFGVAYSPKITFTPESTPLDDAEGNTILDVPRNVTPTNGLFSIRLKGGQYSAEAGTVNKPIAIVVPPDGLTYTFNECRAFATNNARFLFTNWFDGYYPITNPSNYISSADIGDLDGVLLYDAGDQAQQDTNALSIIRTNSSVALTDLFLLENTNLFKVTFANLFASITNTYGWGSGGSGGAATNIVWPVAGTNVSAVTNMGALTVTLSAAVSTAYVDSKAAASTNEALRVSQAATNESFRLAALNTNDALRVSQNATSEVARASAVMTNHVNMVSNAISGQIGGGVVNAAIQATNDSTGQNIATQFGNGTNHALLIGSRATNEATRVSQNATSEVARVSATLQYGTSALTNLSAGNGSALTGIVAAGRATNDSTGQSIAVQFGNITNHVTLTTNAFASATNSLVLNNNYQLLSTWTPASVTNIGGTSATASMWSSLIVSNASASNITLRVDAANVRALGPSTTNALIIAAGKVGLLSVQTFGQLITNYATASQQ